MKNLLLEQIEYKTDKTDMGTWRRYVYPTGEYFAEFTSHKKMFELPLIHYTRGKCPETGRRLVAKGIIAVGRLAAGVLAIGHASFGLVAIGQLGLGLIIGLGQASSGMYALGQLAIGFYFGAGQIATGITAIGQIACGKYVLAQIGIGKHVWTQKAADPEAVEYFRSLLERVSDFIKGL
ncbi:MAG: hypothetical protein AB1499_03210 [Nitrospirota bacterium]